MKTAAAELNVSLATMKRYATNGRIKSVQLTPKGARMVDMDSVPTRIQARSVVQMLAEMTGMTVEDVVARIEEDPQAIARVLQGSPALKRGK